MNAAELIADIGKQIVELAASRRRTHARNAYARTRAYAGELRRILTKDAHVKLYEETSDDLTEAIDKLVSKQVLSAAGKLKQTNVGPKTTDKSLINAIFTPSDWDDELIEVSLPILAEGMVKAALAQLELLGVDTNKRAYGLNTKATSATEWLAEEGDTLPANISTELPEWMHEAISENLRETFSEPYWAEINKTTADDIQQKLRVGLTEGQSTQEMARSIASMANGDYSLARGTLVARTETGDALNGARIASLTALQEELPEVPMRSAWLSVLGNTTRADHAALDGVPADKDGLFNLGGTRVPWPSHASLPVGQRVNCLCTVVTEFGMNEDDAMGLINDASEQIMQ